MAWADLSQSRGLGLVIDTGMGTHAGFLTGTGRVRVAFLGPRQNPYPWHGLRVTRAFSCEYLRYQRYVFILLYYYQLITNLRASPAVLLARATAVTLGHDVTRCHTMLQDKDDDDDTRQQRRR